MTRDIATDIVDTAAAIVMKDDHIAQDGDHILVHEALDAVTTPTTRTAEGTEDEITHTNHHIDVETAARMKETE